MNSRTGEPGAPLAVSLRDRGWCLVPFDADLAAWAGRVRGRAEAAVADPANGRWLRCGGTWFAGVNVLGPGSIEPPVGRAAELAEHLYGVGKPPWGAAQISVCYPGYPQPMDGESAAAYRYRKNRDAAHIDGLPRQGGGRRLGEVHRFILGLPLTRHPAAAAPLVVWDGSHRTMAALFRSALGNVPPADWNEIDLTHAYQEARRRVFEQCRRIALPVRPGEAVIVHRHSLHGVAPWAEDPCQGAEGRMIAYFRPHFDRPEAWLAHP